MLVKIPILVNLDDIFNIKLTVFFVVKLIVYNSVSPKPED
jgi:hypothetical protein